MAVVTAMSMAILTATTVAEKKAAAKEPHPAEHAEKTASAPASKTMPAGDPAKEGQSATSKTSEPTNKQTQSVDSNATTNAPDSGKAPSESPIPKTRVTDPVPGLFDGVKTEAKVSDWHIDDHVKVEPDGTKVAVTKVATPQGAKGFVERAYNPNTKQFEMRNAFLDGLPGWVNEGGPGLDPRGIPTVHYLTLRQMKLLGVNYGGYNKVKMSTIQNVRGVIEFNVLRSSGFDGNVAILKTHSVQYGETTIQQSGERVVAAEVRGGRRTPLQNMLEWFERH